MTGYITIRVGFGSQPLYTDLSCRARFHSLLRYVITLHQHYRQTDRQTDGRHARRCSEVL